MIIILFELMDWCTTELKFWHYSIHALNVRCSILWFNFMDNNHFYLTERQWQFQSALIRGVVVQLGEWIIKNLKEILTVKVKDNFLGERRMDKTNVMFYEMSNKIFGIIEKISLMPHPPPPSCRSIFLNKSMKKW